MRSVWFWQVNIEKIIEKPYKKELWKSWKEYGFFSIQTCQHCKSSLCVCEPF